MAESEVQPQADAPKEAAAAPEEKKGGGDDGDLSFGRCLTHKFGVVDKQVENGLLSLKATADYLTKVVKAQQEAAKAITKESQQYQKKGDALKKGDAVTSFVEAELGLVSVVEELQKKMEDFTAKVTTDVINPLNEFYKTSEAQRKKISSDHEKKNKGYNENYKKLVAQRESAMKLWSKLQETRKKHDEQQDAKKKAALQKDIAKLKKDASKAFGTYENLLHAAKPSRDEHYTKALPDFCAQLQKIEDDRLAILKSKLGEFAGHFEKFETPTESGPKFKDQASNLEERPAIEGLIKTWVGEHGMPPEPPALPEPLPVPYGDLDTDKWMDAAQ